MIELNVDGDYMFEIFEGVLNKYNGEDKIVVIPQEVNSIGEFAFYGCLEIEKVILHENVKLAISLMEKS